jgi:HAD superfamily phosphoserine phosphatase-like hydrolase
MNTNLVKLVCFDLNETLIEENTWYDLNVALGVTPEEDKKMLEDFEAGKISYVEWQKLLEEIYIKNGKATEETILSIINKYNYKKGAKEIIVYLKAKGYKIALLSGSVDTLVKTIAEELNIELYGANNSFLFDERGYMSQIITKGKDATVKVTELLEFCKQLNIAPLECVCVGDGSSDIEIFQLTQHGITFKGSKIEQFAWKSIQDLEDLKNIL